MKRPNRASVLVFIAAAMMVMPCMARDESHSSWKRLSDMAVPRWEAGTVVLDNKLYVFGGYKMPTKACTRVDAFDPKDNSWTKLKDLPSAITHINMVLDGWSVWFAGGFRDGYKGYAISEVWRCDIDKNTYTAGPSLPEPRGSGGLAIVGRKLHFIGGLKEDRDTCSPKHWVLDLEELQKGDAKWEEAKPMPKGRCHFGTVTFDGKIYLTGGMYHHDSKQIDRPLVDIYDPGTDFWSRGEDLPTGHTHAETSTFVHDKRIWFLGDLPPVHLTWYAGNAGKRPPLQKEHNMPDWPEATLFVGSKGMLTADYGRFKLFPEDRFEGVRRPQVPRKPSHTDDWVEACKTNDPLRPGTNFSYSGPLTETVLLGIAAYRAGEKLSWDAENLKITNNPQAERFIRRDEYRKGWTL